MPAPSSGSFDVVVVGAGPAGVIAALRAARLGARTALLCSEAFGGMAAGDGPVPVRTLAHAARLAREARQMPSYGVSPGELTIDYPALLARVDEVTGAVRRQSFLHRELEQAGVDIREHVGTASFVDATTLETGDGSRVHAPRVILCTGGTPRRPAIPGIELTTTHSGAWQLTAVPPSMVVLGTGATGVQVASIFNGLGSRVTLVEAGPSMMRAEDLDVSTAMHRALEASGVRVVVGAGRVERFEQVPDGVRLVAHEDSLDGAVVVVAIGWVAATEHLRLDRAGIELDERGHVRVDDHLRTTAAGVYAAGDVTGRGMIVHEAIRQGVLAATNAVGDVNAVLPRQVSPAGSFTDPEYASVGLTEERARAAHEVVVTTIDFHGLPRPVIDGRATGFCKLVVDRERRTILGCHIVGERAVELAQVAATAMAADMTVEQLARVPFSFPTYANALGRAAITAAADLDVSHMWAVDLLEPDQAGIA